MGTQDDNNEDFSSESSEFSTTDNSSSESGNEEDIVDDQPLYRGSPLTVMESMLLILTILIHHNVTMTCLSDIITVINFHCLSQNLKKK